MLIDSVGVYWAWAFASGCLHATWLLAAPVIHDGETPRLNPDGAPANRLVFIPAAECPCNDGPESDGPEQSTESAGSPATDQSGSAAAPLQALEV